VIRATRAASIGTFWLAAARLRLDAPVRQAACSAGSVKSFVDASYSTTPPVAIADSHSRT